MKLFPVKPIFILAISIFAFVFQSEAQEFSPSTYNLGKVKLYNNPVIKFNFVNDTKNPIVFLPIPYQRNLFIDLPQGYIKPGQSVEISAIYFTEQTGALNVEQPIYTSASNEPIYLKIKGKILSLHPGAITSCPIIDKKKSDIKMEQGMASVVVYDSETGLVINGVDMLFEGQKGRFLKENSRKEMIDLSGLPHGYYQVKLSKTGYRETNGQVYVNVSTGALTFYLTPLIEHVQISDNSMDETEEVEDDFLALENNNDDEQQAIERIRKMTDEKYKGRNIIERDVLVIREQELDSSGTDSISSSEEEIKDDIKIADVPDFDASGSLNPQKYALNNVVFLIDVSGSMKIDNKLEKLKISMKNLVAVLRPEDRLTIVTYSSRSEVVLASCPGNEKDRINAIIDGLVAKGNSFGADGLQTAYNYAQENYIAKGNNQIILATDGLFNSREQSDRDLYALAESEAGKGIHTSVIGFGRKKEARAFMQKIAANGAGNFMEINTEEEANSALVHEIKSNALKQ
jgi:Ca-activated chloride channel family protein